MTGMLSFWLRREGGGGSQGAAADYEGLGTEELGAAVFLEEGGAELGPVVGAQEFDVGAGVEAVDGQGGGGTCAWGFGGLVGDNRPVYFGGGLGEGADQGGYGPAR